MTHTEPNAVPHGRDQEYLPTGGGPRRADEAVDRPWPPPSPNTQWWLRDTPHAPLGTAGPAARPVHPPVSAEPTPSTLEPTVPQRPIVERTIVEPGIVEPGIVEPGIVEPGIVEPSVGQPAVRDAPGVEPALPPIPSAAIVSVPPPLAAHASGAPYRETPPTPPYLGTPSATAPDVLGPPPTPARSPRPSPATQVAVPAPPADGIPAAPPADGIPAAPPADGFPLWPSAPEPNRDATPTGSVPAPRGDAAPSPGGSAGPGTPTSHRSPAPATAAPAARPEATRRQRRPLIGLASTLLLAFVAGFFAWVTAEPLLLAAGHLEAGTATVTRCAGDGLGRRCVGSFEAGTGALSVPQATLVGTTADQERAGNAIPARMVSDRGRIAYAGEPAGLHARWAVGLVLIVLCGLGIAWASGATRLAGRRSRAGAVALSVAAPLLLLAGMLLASW